jgi:hypothetical protein
MKLESRGLDVFLQRSGGLSTVYGALKACLDESVVVGGPMGIRDRVESKDIVLRKEQKLVHIPVCIECGCWMF